MGSGVPNRLPRNVLVSGTNHMVLTRCEFGPIGMFLGPVILALTIALLRWAEEHRAVAT